MPREVRQSVQVHVRPPRQARMPERVERELSGCTIRLAFVFRNVKNGHTHLLRNTVPAVRYHAVCLSYI
jgi:hypothetical protein